MLGVISAACACGTCGWFSCHEEDTTVGHLVHGVRVLDVCGWEISIFSLQIGPGGWWKQKRQAIIRVTILASTNSLHDIVY